MWGPLVINDIVYAEISTRYPSLDAVDSMPLDFGADLVPTPRAALFAGEAYLRCRTAGAHALAERLPLLTRVTLNLIAP